MDADYNAVDTSGGDPIDALKKRILAGLPVVGLGGGTGAQPAPQTVPASAPAPPAVSMTNPASNPAANAAPDLTPPIPATGPATPAVSLGGAAVQPERPGAQQQLSELQAPKRADFPAEKMPIWKKLLGAAASTAAGIRDPNEAGATARDFFGAPQKKADEQFNQAEQQYNAQRQNITDEAALGEKEATTAEAQARTRETDARTKMLGQPKPEKPEDLKIGEYTNAEGHPTFVFRKPTGELYENSVGGTVKEKDGPQLDKKVDEFVDKNNRRMNVMQRPDGTTYNVARGEVRAEAGTAGGQDVKDLAGGIIAGTSPPDMREYGYRDRTALAAELKRQGFDLTKAQQDWTATQKYLATLNGAQQTRLRQAVSFTKDGLDQLEDIYNQWQKVGSTSNWKVFNRGSLATAKQLPGAAGDLANRLEARLADVNSELGTVYKGGNSSTDESLKLAAKNLSGDWNEQTFKDALKDIRESLKYRENSMKLIPAGTSSGNAYTPPATQGGTNMKNPY